MKNRISSLTRSVSPLNRSLVSPQHSPSALSSIETSWIIMTFQEYSKRKRKGKKKKNHYIHGSPAKRMLLKEQAKWTPVNSLGPPKGNPKWKNGVQYIILLLATPTNLLMSKVLLPEKFRCCKFFNVSTCGDVMSPPVVCGHKVLAAGSCFQCPFILIPLTQHFIAGLQEEEAEWRLRVKHHSGWKGWEV